MDNKYITVTQLSRYLKYRFDNDENLKNVYLKGEVSNSKLSRGHLYFTIKDENAVIGAVMFSNNVSKLKFNIEDGMKVLVRGKVSVYEAMGTYKIYVDEIIIDGLGNLYLEYEKLKKKLASEGLFDKDKKKPIPKFPKRIGIVTASTGAAIRDILSTIKRRWPITETILFPSAVQGADAVPDLIKQINKAQEYDLDVLIIGRGGGSIEDMWCFNDEQVARTIYASKIPIISAVGHEVDFTIADFVADLRAPTPTGAAEMAVPNIDDFYKYISQVNIRLEQAITKKLNENKKQLDTLKNNYILKNPISIYEMKEQKFISIMEKINIIITNRLKEGKNSLDLYLDRIKIDVEKIYEKKKNNYLTNINKLEVLNPLLTIKRGYSITKKNNKVINSIKELKVKDKLTIELTDGNIDTVVEKINN